MIVSFCKPARIALDLGSRNRQIQKHGTPFDAKGQLAVEKLWMTFLG